MGRGSLIYLLAARFGRQTPLFVWFRRDGGHRAGTYQERQVITMDININTLSGGAVAERLNRELQRVAENVMDPNTKPDAVRTVTVTIKIKPNETRQLGVTDIQVKSALAPTRGIPAQFIFDYDRAGKAVMAELQSADRNQLMVDNDGDVADDRGSKVVNGNFR